MTRKILLLVLLVCGLGACGDDSTGPPPEGVAGTYTLRSVNGEPLPSVAIQVGAHTWEVTAGNLTLNEDLTCSSIITQRMTRGVVVTTSTETATCTYRFKTFSAPPNTKDGSLSVGWSSGDGTNSTSSGTITWGSGSQPTLELFTKINAGEGFDFNLVLVFVYQK